LAVLAATAKRREKFYKLKTGLGSKVGTLFADN